MFLPKQSRCLSPPVNFPRKDFTEGGLNFTMGALAGFFGCCATVTPEIKKKPVANKPPAISNLIFIVTKF